LRVFKYRGGSKEILKRDIRSLSRNEIYASDIPSLNDLFEARVRIHDETFRVGWILSAVGVAKYNDKVREAEKKFLKVIEGFAKTVKDWGVYSLSKSAVDELLWAYYADSHRGLCLEYDLDELLRYRLNGQEIITVDYSDEVPVITVADLPFADENKGRLLSKLIGTKSKRWAHEGEVRIVTGQPGLFEYDFRALKAIYFGARSPRSLQRLVMRVMAGRGLRYYQVTSKDGHYTLQSEPLEDLYSRPPNYRKSVAPIEDGVPYFDTTLEEYRPLVLKAIEIVRRDPYCEKVIDAYLSMKSTNENPVFYVTYERSDGIPCNCFLSKREIESWSED